VKLSRFKDNGSDNLDSRGMNMRDFDSFSLGTRIALLTLASERIEDMKTIKSCTLLSAVVILGGLLSSGCYTQLALNDDEPEAVVDPQPIEIIQPPPTVIIIEPVFFPAPPPYYAPPVVGTSFPSSAGSQPQSKPKSRDFGNQRSNSGGSGPAGSSSGTRSTGATRRGR